VIEDPALMRRSARSISEICGERGVPLIFKSSYLKDNRTSGAACRGPGQAEGLQLLRELRDEFGMPVTSDVHTAAEAEAAAEVLDLIQIPALLCRQTRLLEAAGRTGRPINIKKGQFMAPGAMRGGVEKVRWAGGEQVLLTERGTTFGYGRLICDLIGVPSLQALGCPVAFDAGHSANEPSEIQLLARAGVASGADALFLECHPDPASASCDGQRMLSPNELDRLLGELLPVAEALRRISRERAR
jgi:2-dehydro-3-deoxyphosphooctonate aldolase (KDO 8-P synthase)